MTGDFLLRLALDGLATCLLVFGVYCRLHRRADLAFSCLVINVVTLVLCFVTQSTRMDIGFALGLFAVFGILRYRTESVPVRDLTYLFAVIGIAMVNGLPGEAVPLDLRLVASLALVAVPALLEQTPWAGQQHMLLLLDELPMLAPHRREELLDSLSKRTGLAVTSVHVEHIDLLKQTAELTLYFRRHGASNPDERP